MGLINQARGDGRELRAYGLVTLAGMLWSFTAVLIKGINSDSLSIAGMRSLIGGAVQADYVVRRLRSEKSTSYLSALKETTSRIFSARSGAHWIGASSFFATMMLLVVALRLTNATNVTFLHANGAVLVAVFSGRFTQEWPTRHDWIALVISIMGMATFAIDGLEMESSLGTWLAIVSAFTMAVAQVCFKLRTKEPDGGELGALETSVLANMMMALVGLPFVVVLSGMPNGKDCLLLLILGTMSHGWSNILYIKGVKHIPVFRSILLSRISTVLTPVWPFIFLGETPTLLAVIGATIVAAAIVYQSTAKSLSIVSGVPAQDRGS